MERVYTNKKDVPAINKADPVCFLRSATPKGRLRQAPIWFVVSHLDAQPYKAQSYVTVTTLQLN